MKVRVPAGAEPWLVTVIREVNQALDKIDGANNRDYKGRRIMNAGNAVDPQDYITLADFDKFFDLRQRGIKAASAKKTAQTLAGAATGSGGGSGTGGSVGAGSTPPTVPLYDGLSIVQAYAAANPTQLADSCQPPDGSGTWDFMDGVVAALVAADMRFGYNGKRGDTSDPSHDAVSYYHGDLGTMTVGSNNVYVIDIIGGHCGSSPTAVFNDVTTPLAAGAWMPSRTL